MSFFPYKIDKTGYKKEDKNEEKKENGEKVNKEPINEINKEENNSNQAYDEEFLLNTLESLTSRLNEIIV